MKNNRRNIYLEDFIVGNTQKSPSYTIPKHESIEFAKHWDPQPFHIDEAAAEQTHGKLTACSAYIFSVFCKVSNGLNENANVHAIAGLGFDELRILQPLFVEDTVHVKSEVRENRRSKSKPDRGIVTSLNKMYNQDGELVFSIISTAMILARKLPE